MQQIRQLADRIPARWRSPALWGGLTLGTFLFFYWLGMLATPYVSPFVRLYGTLFNFVLNPPMLNPFDYPQR
jgi:hypothetical protein